MPDEQQHRRTPDQVASETARDERERRKRSGRTAGAARMADQATWVDQQIRVAMAQGDFDDLPGSGRPIEGLGSHHDPDWWVKKLIEREQITVLPMSLQLRQEDADLDERLDAIGYEAEVRRVLADFNARVIAARYRAPEGPPLITMPRDVDADVAAWTARRTTRLAGQRARLAAADSALPTRRRWWRRR